MQISPRYFDAPALAVFLGISTRSLSRMIKRGDLPQPEKLGRLCRWNEATVDQFLKQRGPSAAPGRAVSFAVPVVYPDDSTRQDDFACRLTAVIEKGLDKVIKNTLKGGT